MCEEEGGRVRGDARLDGDRRLFHLSYLVDSGFGGRLEIVPESVWGSMFHPVIMTVDRSSVFA
jgi:hypothetical protein